MVALQLVFWLLLFFFAAVGAIRGWVREIIVTVALVLGFVIIALFWKAQEPVLAEDPITGAWTLKAPDTVTKPQMEFLKRAAVLLALAFFGYETAGVGRVAARTARVRRQDMVLGFILGMFNGYLLVGSLWYYLAAYGYPVTGFAAPEMYGLEPATVLRYMFPAFILKPLFGEVLLVFLILVMLLIFLILVMF